MNLLKITSFLLLTCIFLLSACNKNAIPMAPYTLQEDIIVTRTKKADYELRFSKSKVWDISIAESPDQIDWKNPTTSFEGDFIEFSKAGKKGRIFFGVTDQKSGDRFIVSERIIPMKGTVNFRDIGGLPVGNNRIVRWGKIFRSDNRVYEVIENKYGGIDNYLEVKFGLDEEKRNLLREWYTMEIPKIID